MPFVWIKRVPVDATRSLCTGLCTGRCRKTCSDTPKATPVQFSLLIVFHWHLEGNITEVTFVSFVGNA